MFHSHLYFYLACHLTTRQMGHRFHVAILLFLLSAIHSSAQKLNDQRLKVFIDCHSGCDMNYIRTEINIIDFVLERSAADVHILITDQNTGSGGDEYQLIFYGQNKYRQMKDTVYFDNHANNTHFEERELLVKYIKLGLTPYILKTTMAKAVSIRMREEIPDKESKRDSAATTRDPWNYWVFRTGVAGNLSAEEAYKTYSASGNFSVDRVTEELKTGFYLNGGQNNSIYEYVDDNGAYQKVTVKNDNYDVGHYLVKSINNHWSWAYEAKVMRNTFSNIDFQPTLRAGIEYNIFPYKLSNTKFFIIDYILDLSHNNYIDTTLYNKTEETLTGQALETTLALNQKWGQVQFGINYHNYFKDWSLFNLKANAQVNVRIVGGLSFNISTRAELIRDQIYLPKQGATPEEVLTRQRQIATGYMFYTSFGINYRFGSKLNNFVNPRFGF